MLLKGLYVSSLENMSKFDHEQSLNIVEIELYCTAANCIFVKNTGGVVTQLECW